MPPSDGSLGNWKGSISNLWKATAYPPELHQPFYALPPHDLVVMKILFVGFESESYSLCRLAKRLESDGHKILLMQGDQWHFLSGQTGLQEYFDDHGFERWVNFEAAYERLYEEDWAVDWPYLRQFERDYCESKNLEQLILSDAVMRQYHHFRRPHFTPTSDEQVYYFAELLLKWIERTVEEFDPDLIFNYRRNYFVKNAVAQMALAEGIPIRSLIGSRIGDYHHLVMNFGLGTDDRIRSYLQTTDPSDGAGEAIDVIEQFETTAGGLYDARSQQRVHGQADLVNPREVLVDWARQVKRAGKNVAFREKRKYRFGRGNYFNNYLPLTLVNYTQRAFNKLRYHYTDPFHRSVPDTPFLYFPLHTLPESSTLTLSTEYFERDLIRFVAKELPAGYTLAVKENPNMVGVRPFSYYDDLTELPNVELIDPNVPSKELLRRSEGVCGISGTALLEGTFLGTPAHAFGTPEFLDVLHSHGFDAFEEFVETCRAGNYERPSSVVNYVQYVLDNGRELDLTAVRNDVDSPAFERGIDTIYKLLQADDVL